MGCTESTSNNASVSVENSFHVTPIEYADQSDAKVSPPAAIQQDDCIVNDYIHLSIFRGAFDCPDRYPFSSWKRKNGKHLTFVSSTFTDTHTERDYLMKDLLPRLRQLGSSFDLEVSFIDMRWGVRDENTLDHMTWIACAREIQRCVEESMGLIFLSLQSQKYGYCPLPKYIPATEAVEMRVKLFTSEQRKVFQEWYHLDDNAVPPQYALRNLVYMQDNSYWKLALPVLIQALEGVEFDKDLFIGNSVTEYETRMIMSNPKLCQSKQIAWLRRQLVGMSETGSWRSFDDTLNDPDRKAKLDSLCALMHQSFRVSNIHTFANASYYSYLQDDGIWRAQLDQWKTTVDNLLFSSLNQAIDSQKQWNDNANGLNIPGKEASEILHHYEWAAVKCRSFFGRQDLLTHGSSMITQALKVSSSKAVIAKDAVCGARFIKVVGESGCGKTALMSKLASIAYCEQQANHDPLPVLVRYCGTTAQSSRLLTLLLSLCHHLHVIHSLPYNHNNILTCFYLTEDRSLTSADRHERFHRLLKYWVSLLDAYPHVLFIDSLDQIREEDNVVSWSTIVSSIPTTCKSTVILSTLPDKNEEFLLKAYNVPILTVSSKCNEARVILENILRLKQRQLTKQQWKIVDTALQHESSVLYLQLCSRVITGWSSFTPIAECKLANSIHALINQILDRLERDYGAVLTRAAFAYLTFAADGKYGVSDTNLVELLSLDEAVMQSVNQYNSAETFPLHVWLRLKSEVIDFLVETVHGTWKWYHRQLWETMKRRYDNAEKKFYQNKLSYYFAPIGIDLGESCCRAGILLEDGVHLIQNEEGQPYFSSTSFFITTNREKRTLLADLEHDQICPLVNFMQLVGTSKAQMELDYYPEELVARLLLEIKKQAQKQLKRTVRNCFITIPNSFNMFQRTAMVQAATIAGLTVDRLVSSSSMLIVGDQMEKIRIARFEADEKFVLYFSVGESGMELAYVTVEEGIFEIKGRISGKKVSGRKITENLYKLLSDRIKTKYEIDIDAFPQAKYRLYKACGRAKHAFSNDNQQPFDVNLLDLWKLGVNFRDSISLSDFDACVEPLFESVEKALKWLISSSKIGGTLALVQEVIYAGGTMHLPQMQKFLRSLFPNIPVGPCAFDLCEATVRGCALQARQVGFYALTEFSNDFSAIEDYLLLEATSFPISVAIEGYTKVIDDDDEDEDDEKEEEERKSDEVPQNIAMVSDSKSNEAQSVAVITASAFGLLPFFSLPLKRICDISAAHEGQESFYLRFYEGFGNKTNADPMTCLHEVEVSGFNVLSVGKATLDVTVDMNSNIDEPIKIIIKEKEPKPDCDKKEVQVVVYRHEYLNLSTEKILQFKAHIQQSNEVLQRDNLKISYKSLVSLHSPRSISPQGTYPQAAHYSIAIMASLAFEQVAEFWITESDPIVPNRPPPILKDSVRAPCPVQDVSTIKKDFFNMHFAESFHDCTVEAIQSVVTEEAFRDFLGSIQIVSDRKTLRRLIANCGLTLPSNSFYIKKETFELIAENVNGVVYIGGKTRYEESRGGFGEGFERLMTTALPQSAATYRVVKCSFGGDLQVLVRHEVDAIDRTGQSVELKCKKEPNPRYGLGNDFFLNIWTQMALSNTNKLRLGLHDGRNLKSVKDYTLAEVQRNANIQTEVVRQALASLKRILMDIQRHVPDGVQAIISCASTGKCSFLIVQPGHAEYPLPVLSEGMRSRLRNVIVPPTLPEVKEEDTGAIEAGNVIAEALAEISVEEELCTVFDQMASLNVKAAGEK